MTNSDAQNLLIDGKNKTAATTQKSTTESKADTENKKNQEIKSVYITISGATYPINCPKDEQDDLDKAVRYINHFIREVRTHSPSIPHEQLLVLCCLNMYEEMKQQREDQDTVRASDKQMQSLIEKIIQDAQSAL